MMGVYPPGSTVQLTDDRYASVIATNSSRPLKPKVLINDPAVPRAEALVLDLETVPGLGIRRSVRVAQLPPTVADYLAPGARVSYFFEPAGGGRGRGVNNPLPVDPFSIAEAARRTWPALIEAMIEAVCLVEPEGLRVVAANGAAGRLFGVAPAELVGRDMRATAATPEDDQFWRRVADSAAPAPTSIPTRTSRATAARPCRSCAASAGSSRRRAMRSTSLALRDRSEQLRLERAAEVRVAELAATLESIGDGVLVVDLAGRISHFNRPFAALWDVPHEMLVLRADDEIFDWMRAQVADPAPTCVAWRRSTPSTGCGRPTRIALRSGAIGRAPDLAAAEPRPAVGRVFSYRLVGSGRWRRRRYAVRAPRRG